MSLILVITKVIRPQILSASFVKLIREPGRYGDGRGGHGLSLLVKPMKNGRVSKSWSQRLIINGKPTHIGLGSYPLISLAEARKRAFEKKQSHIMGKDPRQHIPTFKEAAEQVIKIHSEGWRDGGKTINEWQRTLRDYAFPKLANKQVNTINTADVMGVLLPNWQDRYATMKKLKQRIGTIMKWAVAKGYRDDDPTAALSAALPKHNGATEHQKALPFAEVGAAITKIRESKGYPVTKLAFEFLVLTAARSGEIRGAKWDEVNFADRIWTIPASRMKTGRPHRVPLSGRALEILAEAVKHADNSGLVFPSVRGKVLSDSTISKLVRENGIACVPHGMRSSFRDWAAECTDAPREVCELALAHVNSNRVEAAYRRSDLFERRRALMDEWGKYVCQ